MSKGNPLSVIVVSLLLGIALAMGGDNAKPARDFFKSMFDTLMRIVGWVIMLTPIGVFFLMAWTVGSIGLVNLTGPLALYVGTVLTGLLTHGLIVLPVILFIFGRTNPFQYLVQVRRALMTAFATDSSSATMPVTLTGTIGIWRLLKKASNFVIPLGATVNMDGTALYEAVATVFLFQVFGIDLSMGDLVIVVITATLAAVGAAGIPGAGLVTMVIVIGAVNTSLAGRGVEPLPLYAIGIILGIDRIVDMCRTTVNVWGDAVGAKIMTGLLRTKRRPNGHLSDGLLATGQPTLGIHRSLTPHTRGGDRLAIHAVGDIASGEDPFKVRFAASIAEVDVARVIERQTRAFEELRGRSVTNGHEQTAHRKFFGATSDGVFEDQTGDLVFTQHVDDLTVPVHFHVGQSKRAFLHGLEARRLSRR